jgi:hypothetical protein
VVASIELRVDRTVVTLDRLAQDVDRWESSVKDFDPEKQYLTQRTQLLSVVRELIRRLREAAGGVDALAGEGFVYPACRRIDTKAAFVRRYWRWFADKFDQRRTEGPFAKTLRAADEVAWSLYATAFPEPEDRVGAPPLSFIDAEYEPHTTVRTRPQHGLRVKDDLDELLAALITELPIPVIGLPTTCVDEPWLLILLAHEVGHHVASDALLIDKFAAELVAPLDDEEELAELSPQWVTWSAEVFADCFGVLATGPGLAWALAELERSTDEEMAEGGERYPPAFTRWALMVALARAAGAPVPNSIAQAADAADVPAGSGAHEHADALKRIAKRLGTGTGPVPVELRTRAGFSAQALKAGGAVLNWRDQMRAHGPLVDVQSRSAPRQLVAASVPAWLDEVANAPDVAALGETRSTLGTWLVEQLVRCHEPVERAAPAPTGFDAASVSGDIAGRLDLVVEQVRP